MTYLTNLYLWACERLYHELAPAYDLISRLVSAGAWPRWRRLALAHTRGAVLEVGFGTGELLAETAARGWAVTGLELSPAMHAVAARRLARQDLIAPRVQAAAQALPFAAGAFDSVLATFPAPYILEAQTLAECARVLRPGGRLVIAGLWVRLHWPALRKLAPVFYADPTPAQLDALAARVQAGGFDVTWQWAAAGWADLPILVGAPRSLMLSAPSV
jgi:ubiquinone/menaquinone biosynthesis C-methylase UbiE